MNGRNYFNCLNNFPLYCYGSRWLDSVALHLTVDVPLKLESTISNASSLMLISCSFPSCRQRGNARLQNCPEWIMSESVLMQINWLFNLRLHWEPLNNYPLSTISIASIHLVESRETFINPVLDWTVCLWNCPPSCILMEKLNSLSAIIGLVRSTHLKVIESRAAQSGLGARGDPELIIIFLESN